METPGETQPERSRHRGKLCVWVGTSAGQARGTPQSGPALLDSPARGEPGAHGGRSSPAPAATWTHCQDQGQPCWTPEPLPGVGAAGNCRLLPAGMPASPPREAAEEREWLPGQGLGSGPPRPT